MGKPMRPDTAAAFDRVAAHLEPLINVGDRRSGYEAPGLVVPADLRESLDGVLEADALELREHERRELGAGHDLPWLHLELDHGRAGAPRLGLPHQHGT